MDFSSRRVEARRFMEAVYRYPHEGAEVGLYTLANHQGLRTSSFEEAAQEAVQMSCIEDVHVYHHCCLLTAPGPLRGSKRDAAVIPGLWVDLDIDGPPEVHKSDALPPTREDALELLAGMPYQPSMVIDSGWGLYGWWFFDKPRRLVDEDARERAGRLVSGCQLALGYLAAARGWTVDGTADLARILRVPGTTNWKMPGDPREVRILHESGQLYPPAQLVEAWGTLAPESNAPTEPLPDRITTGNRTRSITRLAGLNRRFNVAETATLAAALEHNRLVCDPPLAEQKVAQTVRGIYKYPPKDSLVATNGAQNSNGKVPTWLELIPLRNIKREPISFAWEPGVIRGGLTILAGDPGKGKGLVGVALAAAMSAGRFFPGKTPAPGKVLWISFEESWTYALAPRLDVAGAAEDGVFQIRVHRPDHGSGSFRAGDLHLLKAVLAANPDITLMVIDPLLSWAGDIDANQTTRVRATLEPLIEVVDERRLALLGIAHINKADLTKVLYRVAHSTAITALARSVIAVGDLEDGRRVLAHIKANNTALFTPIPFTVIGKLHPGIDQTVGSVVWDEPDPKIDITRIFEDHRGDKAGAPVAEQCAEAILELLDGKPAYGEFMNRQLSQRGFSEYAIRRGRLAAGVTGSGGKNGRWFPPSYSPIDANGSGDTEGEIDLTESDPRLIRVEQGEGEPREEEEWTK